MTPGCGPASGWPGSSWFRGRRRRVLDRVLGRDYLSPATDRGLDRSGDLLAALFLGGMFVGRLGQSAGFGTTGDIRRAAALGIVLAGTGAAIERVSTLGARVWCGPVHRRSRRGGSLSARCRSLAGGRTGAPDAGRDTADAGVRHGDPRRALRARGCRRCRRCARWRGGWWSSSASSRWGSSRSSRRGSPTMPQTRPPPRDLDRLTASAPGVGLPTLSENDRDARHILGDDASQRQRSTLLRAEAPGSSPGGFFVAGGSPQLSVASRRRTAGRIPPAR